MSEAAAWTLSAAMIPSGQAEQPEKKKSRWGGKAPGFTDVNHLILYHNFMGTYYILNQQSFTKCEHDLEF